MINCYSSHDKLLQLMWTAPSSCQKSKPYLHQTPHQGSSSFNHWSMLVMKSNIFRAFLTIQRKSKATMRKSILENQKILMASLFCSIHVLYIISFLYSFSFKLSVFKMNYKWSVQVTVLKLLGAICLYASCCIPVVWPLVEVSLGLNFMVLLTNCPLLV